MRVGLISYNGQARNAIGDNLAQKLAFFLDQGADVRVLLQSTERLHPALAPHVQVVGKAEATGPAWDFLKDADLVMAEYAQYYDLVHFLPLLAGAKPRLLLDYHGVTPPELWHGPHRDVLQKGLAQRGLAWCADAVFVHSRFMVNDLIGATGLPAQRVVQIDFPISCRDKRLACPRLAEGQASRLSLLFVGRLAANKRVPVLIEAVARLRPVQPPIHAVILGDQSDLYGEEQRRCQELAQGLGVADRIHFRGSVDEEALAEAYRSADLLVMPSVHEGFCLPIVEAMACGLPVLAARATALPETVGNAGLTFTPDDPDDLARQVRRVLTSNVHDGQVRQPTGKIAIVCFRFGPDVVGGAEASLRKIANALQRQGRQVEVFTTCTRAECDWTNELPAGTSEQEGLLVHRYPIDAHDRRRHHEAIRRIVEAEGNVDRDLEREYLKHSIHSETLMDALSRRIGDFDAVIAGPYLFGLTWDVARFFPDKTLLVPCFHQEPLARLRTWPTVYGSVGGILYHSPEEQELAQTELGINHPGAVEIGTYLAAKPELEFPRGQPPHPRPLSPEYRGEGSYLVYCGRYLCQKDLPRLLEYAARYRVLRPGGFDFVFLGQGEVAIPRVEGFHNLGRVDEPTKSAVLAQAAALVQLSRQESLSLVVLEAWAHGTPVLVDGRCAVLAGQVRRSQGGRALEDFDGFLEALDDLWENPDRWKEIGASGRTYVEQRYRSESAFAERLLHAIDDLEVPLAERMRRRGLERAARSTQSAWRERFGQIVEEVLDAAPRAIRREAHVLPYRDHVAVPTTTRSVLLPLRISNQGDISLPAEGPARTGVICEIVDGAGTVVECSFTPLAGLLLPGKTQTLALAIPMPCQSGDYQMRMHATRENAADKPAPAAQVSLTVGQEGFGGGGAPILEAAQHALVEADRLKRLPDDYLDVTEGFLARLKRWLKAKLLGNFKRGYVDVLSRQQSQVNQQLLVSVQQLAECCAALEHAVRGMQGRIDELEERLAEQNADEVVE